MDPCQLTIGAPVNRDLKLQLTRGARTAPPWPSTGLCPPRSGCWRKWEGGGWTGTRQPMRGSHRPPTQGTRVPLLRARSDHGHILRPTAPGLAWPKPCQPGLQFDPSAEGSSRPAHSRTVAAPAPAPAQHPGQTSRDPPGSGRLTPPFSGGKHYAIQVSSCPSSRAPAVGPASAPGRLASGLSCFFSFLRTTVDFLPLFSKNT